MKKLMFVLICVAGLAMPQVLKAQSPLDKIYEKYAGQDGFTTVNISKDLFQMFMQMGDPKDSSVMEMRKMIENLSGIKVMAFSFDSSKIVKAVSVYNEFAGVFPSSVYKDLMTINEGRQNVRFITKQDAAGKINELVMLMKDKHEVCAISITGVIDLSTVSKLSKGMNIHGMEGLEKIKQKHEK